MPVYAPAVGFTEQRRHPNALLAIVGVHAVVIGAVMSAKMDLPEKIKGTITEVTFVDPIKPPPPEPQPQPPQPRPQHQTSMLYVSPTEVPIPTPKGPDMDTTQIPSPPSNDFKIGPDPKPFVPVIPTVVRTGPRFATPDWALRPPYPADKQRLEEEAVLKLRLSIDERGRVVAVEPVGSADRSFLEAARRHLLAKWRYKPATEDGRPVPSSTVITLRFELESA